METKKEIYDNGCWGYAEFKGSPPNTIITTPPLPEKVDHPQHYNTGKFETIDVIEDWDLGFNLGNCLKYISRAGKKDPSKKLEDLEKALWYLKREISKIK